jgi:hypothetical protein
VKRGEKNRLAGESLRAALEDECRGLVYISETDSEIVPVLVADDRSSPIEEFIEKQAPGGSIEIRPTADFFKNLTADRAWHGEVERERVRRFRAVERIVVDNIGEARLFRAGRISIEIFVLGYDADGNIAGIRTQSVET